MIEKRLHYKDFNEFLNIYMAIKIGKNSHLNSETS